MYSVISLSEVPDDREVLANDGLEIVDEGWVEVPLDLTDWPSDGDHLARRTLGRCRTDPRHYKLFPNPEEADRSGFEPTGMSYGGAYTPTMWARFVTAIPSLKAFHAIGGNDPPGAVDLALSYLRRHG